MVILQRKRHLKNLQGGVRKILSLGFHDDFPKHEYESRPISTYCICAAKLTVGQIASILVIAFPQDFFRVSPRRSDRHEQQIECTQHPVN